MEKNTLNNAIKKVLSANESLRPKEIYEKIIEQKLFQFESNNPIGIVNSEVRKSCVGINLKKSKPSREFELEAGNKYRLIRK